MTVPYSSSNSSGQEKETSNESEYGFRVSPSEIHVSEKSKKQDPVGLFQDFEAASHDLKEVMERSGLKQEMIKAEQEVQKLIEETHFEKHSGLEFIEVLAQYAASHPLPSKTTVWAKCALMDKFMKSAEAAGHTIDSTFLIASNLDLSAEIGASGMLDTTEKNPYRTGQVLRYMSSTISGPTELYYFAFDNSNKVDQYFVERAMCTLYVAYSDEDRMTREAGLPPGERTRDFGYARRNALNGLISGVRAEAATWMYFDTVFDEIAFIPDLSDETLKVKFGLSSESEAQQKESIEQLRALADEIKEASEFGDEPFNLFVKHAPSDLDRYGIADLVVVAREIPPKNTKVHGNEPEKKLKEKQILLIEVKSYPPKQAGDPALFSGVYPVLEDNILVAENIDTPIEPKIPDAAERHTMKFGKAVLSVRIPNTWTTQASSTVETKDFPATINGNDVTVHMQNIEKTLSTMSLNNAKATRRSFRSTVTKLLKNQNSVRI